MPSYVTPRKNVAYIFYVGLVDQSNTKLLKANPTLASGDAKISIDGGSFSNLTNLPTVTPASGTAVQLSLTSTEMNGDNIVVTMIDAAGAEWCDLLINIQTSARQIDDLAYPATSGRSMVVDSAGLVDANTVKLGPSGSGTAQTARDVGASVLLSSGSGTGQLDFTSGVVKSSLAQILGTAFTEGAAGRIAAAFKQFFNIASPAATMDHGVLVDTVTTYTGNTPQTGDAYARLGAPAGASISADIAEIEAETDTIPSAASVASAVWDEALSGHTTAGSAGKRLSDIATGTPPTAAAIASAVWDEATSGHSTAGTTGKALTDTLGAVDTEVAAIKAKTDSLTFTVAGMVDANVVDWKGATAPAMTGDAYARLGAPAGASIAADIAELETETDDVAAIKAQTDKLTFDGSNRLKVNAPMFKNVAHTAFMFQMTDSTSHAPKTGLVNADFSVKKVSLDGGAFATIAGTITEVGYGFYKVDLASGETNGNIVALAFKATGADARSLAIHTTNV